MTADADCCDCLACGFPFSPATSRDAFTCSACVASSPYRSDPPAQPAVRAYARAASLAMLAAHMLASI